MEHSRTLWGQRYATSFTIPIGDNHHAHFSVGKRVEGGVRNIIYEIHNIRRCDSAVIMYGQPTEFDLAVKLGLPTELIADLTEQEIEIISARFCPMRKEVYDIEQARIAEVNERMALYEQHCQRLEEEERQRQEEERQRDEVSWDVFEQRVEEAISRQLAEYEGQSVEEPNDDNFQGSEIVTTLVSFSHQFTEDQLRELNLQTLIDEDQDDAGAVAVDTDIEFPLEFEDANECPVCREEEYALPNCLLRLPCCHTICKSCLKHVSTCPQCRKTIDRSLVKRKKL